MSCERIARKKRFLEFHAPFLRPLAKAFPASVCAMADALDKLKPAEPVEAGDSTETSAEADVNDSGTAPLTEER